MNRIDWYFDFISPFSYLASESLQRFPADVEIHPVPVLFAGLLQHWQTKGPAEIEPMRQFTFRYVTWLAEQNDIPIELPPAHPFNPLRLLRLSIAMGGDVGLVQQLFRFVWARGASSDDPRHWQELTDELGIDDAEQRIANPEVKWQLRQNTENAIERGIFGVPGFVINDEIFWGFDSIDFLLASLENPALLSSPSMQAADTLPEGLVRKV